MMRKPRIRKVFCIAAAVLFISLNVVAGDELTANSSPVQTDRVRKITISPRDNRRMSELQIGGVLYADAVEKAARFVMQVTPSTSMPRWRATTTSGTVDIPTASPPERRAIATSARVS